MRRISLVLKNYYITTKFIKYDQNTNIQMHIDSRQLNDEYLMKIKAVGINRAECLQRQGHYKPTRQEQSYLGLEAAGEIYHPITKQKLFDGASLLSGGAYAQWATVKKTNTFKLLPSMTFEQGAALPEAWLTGLQLIRLASLNRHDKCVIYAAASGVGTACIQMCNMMEIDSFGVVSNQKKKEFCLELGAQKVVTYENNPHWNDQLVSLNQDKLFDAVFDCVGVQNVAMTINLLGIDSKWILYGLLGGGAKTNINFAKLLAKRINLITTLLKNRSDSYKAKLIRDFQDSVLPKFQIGIIKPVIYCNLFCDWSDTNAFSKAHLIMQSNSNMGKIIVSLKNQ